MVSSRADRIGLIAFGDALPDLGDVPGLIGDDPVVAEEFDVDPASVVITYAGARAARATP